MPSHSEWIKQQIAKHHQERYGGSFRVHIGSTDEKPVTVTLRNMPKDIKERVIDKLGIDKSNEQVSAFLETKSPDEYEVISRPINLPAVEESRPIIVGVEITEPKPEEKKVEIDEAFLKAKAKGMKAADFKAWAKKEFGVAATSEKKAIEAILKKLYG